MLNRKIQTYTLAQKDFCWSGIGARDTASADRNMSAHRHSFFQIFFVASGAATHEIGGRLFEAGAGSIFFVSPFTIHRVSFPVDAECYVVYFSGDFLLPGLALPEAAAAPDQLLRQPELAPFVFQSACDYVLAGEEIAQVRYRCQRIEAASQSRGVFDAAEARAELVLLLTLVGKKYLREFKRLEQSSHAESTLDKRARLALDFLKQHFARPLTLEDVASEVHLTGSYLTHLLKRETGKSFKQLLDELRLENSKNLLAYTDSSMNRIAEASGFLDQAHFARRFRSLTQQTPGQFRRQHRTLMQN